MSIAARRDIRAPSGVQSHFSRSFTLFLKKLGLADAGRTQSTHHACAGWVWWKRILTMGEPFDTLKSDSREQKRNFVSHSPGVWVTFSHTTSSIRMKIFYLSKIDELEIEEVENLALYFFLLLVILYCATAHCVKKCNVDRANNIWII